VARVVEVERGRLAGLDGMMLEVMGVRLERGGDRGRWFLVGGVARRETVYLALVVVEERPCVWVVVVELMELMGQKEVARQNGALQASALRYLQLVF